MVVLDIVSIINYDRVKNTMRLDKNFPAEKENQSNKRNRLKKVDGVVKIHIVYYEILFMKDKANIWNMMS